MFYSISIKMRKYVSKYLGVNVSVLANNEAEAKQKVFDLVIWKARKYYYSNVNVHPELVRHKPEGEIV